MDVLAPLSPYLDAGAPAIILIGAIFSRISAIAFLTPGIGERAVPVRVRLTAAIAITIIIAPMVLTPEMRPPSEPAAIAALYAAEALSGLLIGFALRIMVFILQIAGAITAQSLSLAQLFGPTVGFDSESPFAAILVMAGVALAAATGLHIHLVGAIADVYEALPFGLFPGAEETGEWSTNRVGAALFKSLALASPFVILGFLYSLALAAASRAMPQLLVALVGVPLLIGLGMLGLYLAIPEIFARWALALADTMSDPLGGLTG